MFGIGTQEIILIVLVVLLFFGGKKIQELMKETSKLSPERQKLFSRAIKLLWTEGNKAMKETVKQTVKRTVKQSPLKK